MPQKAKASSNGFTDDMLKAMAKAITPLESGASVGQVQDVLQSNKKRPNKNLSTP